LRRGQFGLQLHAAGLLLVLRQSMAGAARKHHAAKSDYGKARAAKRVHGRDENATKIATDAHDWFLFPGTQRRIMRPLNRRSMRHQ
jgi:hypothetical protein